MIEGRQSFRFRKHMDFSWSVPDQNVHGAGKIYNLSQTGMLFETDRLFLPEHGLELCFSVKEIPCLPVKGKLVWFRKVTDKKPHYRCGVRFTRQQAIKPEWTKWLDESISRFADAADNVILSRYLENDTDPR
jgi:hypothetical protein